MIDRIVARALDTAVFCAVVLVTYLPFLVIIVAEGLGSMMEPGGSDGSGALVGTGALALAVGLAWEPMRQLSRGRTFGRSTVGIELRDHSLPRMTASAGQVLIRYLVSVGASGAAVVVAFAVALRLHHDLTSWSIIGLVVIPSALVWLTALLTASFRADSRGWHDLLAGTVLVSTFVLPAARHDESSESRDG